MVVDPGTTEIILDGRTAGETALGISGHSFFSSKKMLILKEASNLTEVAVNQRQVPACYATLLPPGPVLSAHPDEAHFKSDRGHLCGHVWRGERPHPAPEGPPESQGHYLTMTWCSSKAGGSEFQGASWQPLSNLQAGERRC